MAKAWSLKDRRGGLVVRARGNYEGRSFSRDKTIPNGDQQLAEETVRELNRRFMLGDLTWLIEHRMRPKAKARRSAPGFTTYSNQWLEHLEGQIEESTRMSYRSAAKAWQAVLVDMPLDRVTTSQLVLARTEWVAAGRRDRTIGDRMGLLKLIYRDATFAGVVSTTPFDTPMPRRTTKRARRDRSTRRVTFQPFSSDELTRILEVARNPTTSSERKYFPLTEYLLLTGQRFGEGAALRFDDISRSNQSIMIRRARPPVGEATADEPTKTGSEWIIRMTPAMTRLLSRQRAAHFLVGNGWVFPTESGTALLCSNWRRRGWEKLLARAKVDPREGDAQKALRRTYICSALVCGRNPKLVAAELGHATARMVTDQYDSFLDPAHWPDPKERSALASIFGWTDARISEVTHHEATGS